MLKYKENHTTFFTNAFIYHTITELLFNQIDTNMCLSEQQKLFLKVVS